ncbi:MAG: hypothetical protein K2M16_04555 [Muribaculaceae bacterium]|nr:hypothetical protein [Muribaculaceae bacterium]
MKKFTLLSAAIVAAMGANAQIMIDWNEEGQYTFHAEDFVAEGSISWSEDDAAFVCDGTGEGKIMLNLDGKTIDFSEVASIQVKGSWESGDESADFGPSAWNENDPLKTLFIQDEVNGVINEWWGSRYSVDYKGLNGDGVPYYTVSAKIDAFYFTARTITEGEGEEAVVTGSVPGLIYIDDVVLTKVQEKDPQAISIEMWHNWTAWDATAEIDTEKPFYGEDNVGKNIGAGAVLLGTGNVLGCEFADLTEFAGIYIKGTPGMQLRLLFNRPDMEGGSAPISECNPVCDENGECNFMFTELANAEIEKFGAAYPYVHLNSVKTPWGLPEGVESVKVQKFNFIEKGADPGAVNGINAAKDADVIYNVFGQKVDENYRGIVIKNGKKFINK